MLVAVGLGLLVLAMALWWLAARARRAAGLPQGRVVYADTGAWQRNEQPLFSARHRLSGKPDYLVRDGEALIPVEVKSGPAPAAPRAGHVLQVAAYCLLVHERFGYRPNHGLVKYDDRQFAVDYTPALEAEVLRVLGAMRAAEADRAGAHRDHADARRCAACGVREECDERLV